MLSQPVSIIGTNLLCAHVCVCACVSPIVKVKPKLPSTLTVTCCLQMQVKCGEMMCKDFACG